MPEKPFQIFMSYARVDDAPAPGAPESESRGFVTALFDDLTYEFQQAGELRPRIWRDTRRVADGDQFDDRIREAIDDSSLLIVVLSKNWMNSEYCQKELAAFAERWKDGSGPRERVILVGKRHVDPDKRPSLLQGQSGYLFYTREDPDEIGMDKEFFARGKVRDSRYYERIEKLSAFLQLRAKQVGSVDGGPTDSATPVPEPAELEGDRRKIYVAKPAGDTREAYDRVVKELTGSGYVVVPDPAADVPLDSSITGVIDAALVEADASVHLLGEKPGFAPEGEDPIVRLQLARAGAAVAARAAGPRPFKRLIWAPKVLSGDDGQAAGQRDPLAVLARFDRYLDSDSVEGDTLSKFSEFLVRRLGSPLVQPAELGKQDGQSRLYLLYSPQDMEYAFGVAKALHDRNVTPMTPALEGSDAEKVQWHQRNLRECDSVVMCWAAAPDVWAKATARELADWRQLGRTKMFDRRALIAGPPPGLPKKMFVDLLPKDEIDVVVDLTARDQPLPRPEDLNPLLPAQ